MAELQVEDALRMRRLSEEVRSRLLELALINSRTVGIEIPKNANIQFVPGAKVKAMDAGAGDWMELIMVDVNGGQVEVCYGVINGEPFAESPCGG
jgi:hypothetical protein